MGKPLTFREKGEGEPVVLVHGLGASSHVWDLLEWPGHRLVAVDLASAIDSHRSSAAAPRRRLHGPAQLAHRIARALTVALREQDAAGGRGSPDAGLSPGPFGVIGHSLGGLVALELAALAPERVPFAILINVPARLPGWVRLSCVPWIGEAVSKISERLPPSRAAIRLYLRMLFADPAKVTDSMVDAYTTLAADGGYHSQLLSLLRGLAVWRPNGQLAGWSVPTAIVWGDRDPLLPVSVGVDFARGIPGASFHVIESCGHSPPEEAPERLGRLCATLFPAGRGR